MRFEQGRALVIGVATYADASPLPQAVRNDACDVADALRSPDLCGYPDDNVTVLIDGDATLEGIRKALADLAVDCTPEDTVAIFFSGHGTRLGRGDAETSALVPWDYRRSDPRGTTLGEVELSEALAAIKASRLVMVMDACHAAGAASLRKDAAADLFGGFDEKSLERLARGVGRVVLASCRASETSIVFRSARNSVFSTAFLDGLRGAAPSAADGTIRIFDLFNHIAEKVRQAVPGQQHPIFKASGLEDNFPVALALGGRKALETSPSNRDLQKIMSDLYPAGPTDQDIWLRAGGDLSRLKLGGTGQAAWFSALRILSQGGGGSITRTSLVNAALDEFPNHHELAVLQV